MIDFSGEQPVWPSEARKLWAACVRDASCEEHLWRVPAPRGDDELRSRLGIEFATDPADITIVAGARAAAMTYGRIAERVLAEAPTFLGLVPFLGARGLRVEHFGWERMPMSMSTGTVLLVTSPGRNPDGATLATEQRTRLEGLVSSGCRVVLNSTYFWFRPDALRVRGADLLVSFHKLAGAGARLGFVSSGSFFDDAVPEIASAAPSPVWQRAWARFLFRHGLEYLKEANIRPAAESCGSFVQTIDRLSCGVRLPAIDGPNLLFPLPSGVDEKEAMMKLEIDGYRVSPGSAFAAPWPSLRLNFTGTTPEQAAALARALVCGR